MKLFSGSAPDQYYAVTSRLAARGLQQTTMRLVGVCILIVNLPALLALTNPHSMHTRAGPFVLLVVALALPALAWPWFRHRWPARTFSRASAMFGSLVLGTACVLATDPLAGLLIATTFAFILGYAGLFHGPRMLTFTVVASAVTVGWLAVRIALQDVPTALAVVIPVALINVAVAYACLTIGELTASQHGPTDLEPLTGLLTRQAFDEAAGNLIGARNRDDDRYLAVVVVTIDSFAAVLSVKGSRGVDSARVAIGQALRETVRRDAIIGHVGDSEFLVADTFTTPDPSPLAERIRSSVAAAPGGMTASIGVVSTPLRPLVDRPPQEVLDEVIALATAAMHRARRQGGNKVEYDLEPDLKTD